MKAAIRQWIETRHQPWRADPTQSLYFGRIGAPGALLPSQAVRSYYQRHGMPVDGQFAEDLMESELFKVLETVSGWLPADDRRRLDESAAFGMASTHEPNACARRCGDGHAILIDFGFVSTLIVSLDLFYSTILGAGPVNKSNFALALNTTVASQFFHVVPTEETLPFRAGPDFPFRPQVDSALWFLLVFIMAHEVGHILLGHFEDAAERNAVFHMRTGRRKAAVMRPVHRQEFEADRFALKLILHGAEHGGLFNNRDPQRVAATWQGNYGILAWLFTVLDVVEIVSARIGMPLADTHPSGGKRWSRLGTALWRRRLIWPEMRRRVQAQRGQALESARSGPLPTVNKEALKRLDLKKALPSDLIMQVRAAAQGAVAKEEWQPPAAFTAWFATPTPEAAKRMLNEHPELLDRRMDAFIYEQAVLQDNDNDKVAAQMVMLRLPLLQRCREAGIDAAFEEAAAGKLPPPTIPHRTFSMPTDALQQFDRAWKTRRHDLCEELALRSPELVAVLTINDTIARLVRAETQSLTQWILHTHPELMHPFADEHFEATAAAQISDLARRRVEIMRCLVARCREIGFFKAVAELQQRSS